MPFNYFVRSVLYETITPATFETCVEGTASAVCLQEETPGAGVPGAEIIAALERVMPIADAEDSTVRDILILIAIGMVYKTLYTVGVIYKTRQVTKIHQEAKLCETSNKTSSATSSQRQDEESIPRTVAVEQQSSAITSQGQLALPETELEV